MNNKKNKITRYTALNMCLWTGMGMNSGLIICNLLFDENSAAVIIPCVLGVIGILVGLFLGLKTDKKFKDNAMEIIKIESVETSFDKIISVIDKSGKERSYEVSPIQMKREKFRVGDRVAEVKENFLISLEYG